MRNELKNNRHLLIGPALLIVGLGLILSQIFTSNKVEILPIPATIKLPTTATVSKIIDGDSIVLSDGSEVRYIGIDTPEIQLGDCYATEAAKANSDLVLGKVVTLTGDASDKDKYGRLLRYIYVDNQFVNDYLVKNGFAKVMTVPPDTKFSNEFTVSENYAKENGLGLWRKCLKK